MLPPQVFLDPHIVLITQNAAEGNTARTGAHAKALEDTWTQTRCPEVETEGLLSSVKKLSRKKVEKSWV